MTSGNMTAAGLVMPLVVIALLLLVAGAMSVTADASRPRQPRTFEGDRQFVVQ